MVETEKTPARPSRAPHLGEDVFERLMMGDLDAFERRTVRRHLEECAECSRIHGALIELEAGARTFDAGVPAAGRGVGEGPRRAAWIGLAAAAALALALLLPWRSRLSTPVPESPDTIRAGERLDGPVLVAPVGRVSAVSRLAWRPVAGAESYRVELFDADAEPLWTSPPTAASEVPWPPAIAARSGLYYWRVSCAIEGGAESLTSGLERFELTPVED
jgi:hypothetical protein